MSQTGIRGSISIRHLALGYQLSAVSRSEKGLLPMQDFRNLQVWGKAHRLTLAAYRVTVEFPRHELYGLVSQVRRSSASIATNIAEGCGRRSDADFRRFVAMALASASEVEYQFLLAHDLGYLEETKYRELDRDVVEVKRMLTGLMKKIASGRLAG